MANFSVDCTNYKLNDVLETFADTEISGYRVLETDHNEIRAIFYIVCDGDDSENGNLSFNLEYSGDDEMFVEQNRCEVGVYIKPNKTPYEKNFILTLTHANDRAIFLEINITQKAEEFKVEITSGATIENNTYTKQLNSIIANPIISENQTPSNYNYYEDIEFIVKVTGGSEKYRVDTILRCHKDSQDAEQITYYDFDNGFILNKFNDKFIIRNYGKPFLEDDYYLIRLTHEDYREASAELMLTYSQVADTPEPHPTPRIPLDSQKSVVYLTYEERLNSLQKEITIVEEEHTYAINLLQQIGEYLVVNGMQTNITIPFEVLEDNEPSNLMVVSHAYANWCTALTDSTNRNLVINILDTPILERNCYINIYILDKPDVNVAFTLKNIPLS